MNNTLMCIKTGGTITLKYKRDARKTVIANFVLLTALRSSGINFSKTHTDLLILLRAYD